MTSRIKAKWRRHPRRFAPRHQMLRSLAGRHQSCQPAAGATQAVTPAADLPSSCHYAKDKGNVCWNDSFGLSTIYVASSLQLQPAALLPCLVCLKKWCETHQTLQQGRQALVSTGRHSLAALAVSRRGPLLSPRHAAGAVLARVRPAGSVSVQRCRGGSRSCSATCQSPAGCAGKCD